MNELKFLEELASSFERLPGVGKKTANRYAYYIVEHFEKEDVEQFAKALVDTKEKICHCSVCGMLTISKECEICTSKLRDNTKIMVLKDTKDIIAVEKTGTYNGLYHSLNGLISPMDGMGPDEINISSLEKRIIEPVNEIILATPFTPSGETTAMYLEKILSKKGVNITRLGYGLPAGGDIEYVDDITLKRAIDNRSKQ